MCTLTCIQGVREMLLICFFLCCFQNYIQNYINTSVTFLTSVKLRNLTLFKKFFFLYHDYFVCHWIQYCISAIIHFKELQSMTLVFTLGFLRGISRAVCDYVYLFVNACK